MTGAMEAAMEVVEATKLILCIMVRCESSPGSRSAKVVNMLECFKVAIISWNGVPSRLFLPHPPPPPWRTPLIHEALTW